MKWHLQCGDILNQTADVLICSANPYLTMSGGVGGAYRLRYGNAVQDELRAYLASSSARFVPRGSVVKTTAGGGPYLAVLHAVGVDALYATTTEIICETLRTALRLAAELKAIHVAVAAIGTGYGRMSAPDFGRAITPLFNEDFPPIGEAYVCVRNGDDYDALRMLMPSGKSE